MKFLQNLLSRIARSYREVNQDTHLKQSHQTGSSLSELMSTCRTLMQDGGEASRILTAQKALISYSSLEIADRHAFFSFLAEHYAADSTAVHAAYAIYRDDESNANLQQLFAVCEPRRQELLRRLNLCQGGTFELVKMRDDLLRLVSKDPKLEPLDADFVHLFSSWFNRGFLVLETIDWNTPAVILEKIIDYEAVHEIQDWRDLRRRLDPQDRRCYGFFHPAIGDEPLVFVEVALCRGIPDNVQAILGTGDEIPPGEADTAVFYSISNCQRGLKGISFGNFLIKQVVQELRRELANLQQFVTLSPVPGFARWLTEIRDSGHLQLSDAAEAAITEDKWVRDEQAQQALGPELQAYAAHYLLKAKRRNGMPLDPVARFHLGNGASLYRINWPGDTSTKGLHQAHGLMVNYCYKIDEIEQNHEAYSREGRVVCAPDIQRQANRATMRKCPPVDV